MMPASTKGSILCMCYHLGWTSSAGLQPRRCPTCKIETPEPLSYGGMFYLAKKETLPINSDSTHITMAVHVV